MAKSQSPGKETDEIQTPSHPKWEDYQETILVRNPNSGEVNAVADLVQKDNRYEVHVTQPLTKNAPRFFELKDSGAVAAFIRTFKSQKDNAIDYEFLKVPFNSVQDTVTALLRLTQTPQDKQGLDALHSCTINTAKLEQFKFDQHEIPRAELAELGIQFDSLNPETQDRMRMALPISELVPAKVEVSPGVTVAGEFTPRFYRDHNDQLKVALDTPLARPEFESEEYKMMFSTQERAQLVQRATLQRLIMHKDAVTGREEWCYVAFNPATNRLVFKPKNEVEIPSYSYHGRISQEGRKELEKGGSAHVENCYYSSKDSLFSGKIAYDVFRGEFVNTPIKYERPYIPKSILEQLSDRQIRALQNYEKIDGENIRSSNGKTYKGCDLQISRESNSLTYQRRERQQSEDQRKAQDAPQQRRGMGL